MGDQPEGNVTTHASVTPDTIIKAPDAPVKPGEFVMPEKFKGKSIEDVIKAYGELEKVAFKGKPSEPPPAEKPAEPKADTPLPSELTAKPQTPEEKAQAEATKALADAKIDMASMNKEYAENNGKLSDASMAKLAKAGFDKDTVEAWIEGNKARMQLEVMEAANSIGGAERFQSMMKWVGTLAPADIKAYNDAVTSPDKAARMAAVKTWHARFSAESGAGPARTYAGTGGAAGALDKYEDQSQMLKDMNAPEYKTSEAFRNKVIAKVRRSMHGA